MKFNLLSHTCQAVVGYEDILSLIFDKEKIPLPLPYLYLPFLSLLSLSLPLPFLSLPIFSLCRDVEVYLTLYGSDL
jgi:hypothetical protein